MPPNRALHATAAENHARGCLDQWYEFETQCTEQALKEWCEVHQIELIPSDEPAADSARRR